jgi:hypothetical protein
LPQDARKSAASAAKQAELRDEARRTEVAAAKAKLMGKWGDSHLTMEFGENTVTVIEGGIRETHEYWVSIESIDRGIPVGELRSKNLRVPSRVGPVVHWTDGNDPHWTYWNYAFQVDGDRLELSYYYGPSFLWYYATLHRAKPIVRPNRP